MCALHTKLSEVTEFNLCFRLHFNKASQIQYTTIPGIPAAANGSTKCQGNAESAMEIMKVTNQNIKISCLLKFLLVEINHFLICEIFPPKWREE